MTGVMLGYKLVDWRLYAACNGMDTDMFIEGRTSEALEICSDCHVALACLRYAVDNDLWGVWGNTTTYSRRNIRLEDIPDIEVHVLPLD